MQLVNKSVVEFTTDSRKKIKLTYSITVSGKGTQYGISVLKEENGQIEEKTVNDISHDVKEVTSLIKTLADNKVTPISVLDVVYDYLCKKYTLT